MTEETQFAGLYLPAARDYLKLGLIELQDERCRLFAEAEVQRTRYRYDVRFWAKYYAANDAWSRAWSHQTSFQGGATPCTWPSRSEGVVLYGTSGQLVVGNVGGKAAVTPAERARTSAYRSDEWLHHGSKS